MTRRTTPEERARAMAVYATDDETRLHGSADETEVVMTVAGAAHLDPEPDRTRDTRGRRAAP
jgi:hypothetical protein